VTMPFGYVSPEQIMKDRADYARKNIARGRDVLILSYAGGILFVTENSSRSLHKISEIYDRIAFAAVGLYHEFENLRVAGVRMADLRGYSYDRRDVNGRALANTYAQIIGNVFSSGGEKPFVVEITLAEVGDSPESDQLYRLTYDGSVTDEHGVVVMGGSAEALTNRLREQHRIDMSLEQALPVAVQALGSVGDNGPREIAPTQLEAAVLDRGRTRRTFRRLAVPTLTSILGGPASGG